MARRGFSLIEILTALVIFAIVGSMGFYVLSSQNRSWKTESDKTSVQMMAKGTLDALTRAVRMTGSGLPDGVGGLKVYGSGDERVTFVMNDDAVGARVLNSAWTGSAGKELHLAVDSAQKFVDSGYVRLDLRVPPKGVNSSPTRVLGFVLKIKDVMTANAAGSPACGDSLILDGHELYDSGWSVPTNVEAVPNGSIQALDSITYRKSGDTLWLKRNSPDSTIFALGVDSLSFWYYHPVAGWSDSLSGVAPANQIQKVRIRLVLRTRTSDRKLALTDSLSRGYRFSKMETEVGIRAAQLLNK